MKKFTVIALSALTLIALTALALSSREGGDDLAASNHSQPPTVRGMRVVLTLPDLKEASELVIKGSPTSRKSLQKLYASSPGYPTHLATTYPDELHNIEEITFNVDEYYKGSGPQTISVMIDQGSHQLDEGTTYVLFLFRSDTAEGRAYWNDGYLIQGPQGLWTVNGETATRQMGEEKSLTLTQLSHIPAATP